MLVFVKYITLSWRRSWAIHRPLSIRLFCLHGLPLWLCPFCRLTLSFLSVRIAPSGDREKEREKKIKAVSNIPSEIKKKSPTTRRVFLKNKIWPTRLLLLRCQVPIFYDGILSLNEVVRRCTYDGHESQDVMDQVVTVVGDHLAIGHHQDLDETLLRDGTPGASSTGHPFAKRLT